MYEYEATIPTLWSAVRGKKGVAEWTRTHLKLRAKTNYTFLEFTAANPGLVSPDNAMGFVSDDGGETYNRCHCKKPPPTSSEILTGDRSRASVWSNFEIGDLDFWRGEAYSKFVEFLDEKGGFYYEVRGNGTET